MQLGTRWAVGVSAPAALPEVVSLAIETVESDLRESEVDVADWRWTLTYLERAPRLELDDGTRIEYDAHQDAARIILPAEPLDDPFDD